MKKFISICTKILNKITIPLITIFVILVFTWAITYTITASKSYYRIQFEKNNTAETLYWVYDDPESGTRVAKSYDSDDLEIIMNQIVDYITDKESSMQVIDKEGMKVFSNQALKHMSDVKKIYTGWKYMTIVIAILLVLLFVYYFKHKRELSKNAKKQLLITYIVIGSILLVLVVMLLINSSFTFTQFHHILFPRTQDFNDAFFSRKSNYEEEYYINNLLLVQILTEDIFIDAAWIIILVIVLSSLAWIITLLKITKKQLNNNSKINLA